MQVGFATDHGGYGLKEPILRLCAIPGTRCEISALIGWTPVMIIRTLSYRWPGRLLWVKLSVALRFVEAAWVPVSLPTK